MKLSRNFILSIILAFAFFSNALAATFPKPPTSGSFILDEAKMISETDNQAINVLAKNLLREKNIPIFVVTIESLATYGSSDGIEKYETELFNNWGIGYKGYNYGILLLISKQDRKARIEFGAAFDHRYDADAKKVMDNLILPNFKQGQFSLGIVDGVKGLDAMVRGLALPKPEVPKWFLPAMILLGILIIGIAYSLFKSGRTGWGWAFIVFIGMLIWFLLRNAGSGRGGGSGGGGGATGSW